MFVQVHMLQSMPPGNLNRDDTGQPKKCIFGGVTRGRISSQCLKRNIRRSPQFKRSVRRRPGGQNEISAADGRRRGETRGIWHSR